MSFLLLTLFSYSSLFDAIFYERCTVWASITQYPCKWIDISHRDSLLIMLGESNHLFRVDILNGR